MPYDPVIVFLYIYPIDLKINVYTKLHMNIIEDLFIITEKCKQPRCPSAGEGIKNTEMWNKMELLMSRGLKMEQRGQ